jgi:hypothetical protein
MRRLITVGLLMLGMMCSTGRPAQAIPSADLRYSETDLGGGTWRYDYSMYNTSDPVLNAGFNAYDVLFTLDPAATLTVVSLPPGWDSMGGTGGFWETFSLNPGIFPAGSDVAPGTSLTGFSFDLNQKAGDLPFEVLLSNPNDPDNPALFSGTSAPEGGAPVPEPSTVLLFCVGLGGMLLYRRKISHG